MAAGGETDRCLAVGTTRNCFVWLAVPKRGDTISIAQGAELLTRNGSVRPDPPG